MSDVASPPRPAAVRLDVVAHVLAAFAVGSIVVSAAFVWAGTGPSGPYGLSLGFDLVDVTPELSVLIAVGLALIAPLRRFAWFVAAAGVFGLAGLFLQGTTLDLDQLYLLLAVCAGLQLAGVLLAFTQADRAARWGVAVGFGFGIAAGRYLVSMLVKTVREGLFAGSSHSDDVVIAVLGVICVAASIGLLLRSAAPAVAQPSTSWAPVIAIGVAAVAAVGLSKLWQLVLDDVAHSSTGGISQQRAEVIESMDQLARVAIAGLIGIILLIAAYRRGGANLARWVVVGFGLAVTSATVPVAFRTDGELIGRVLVPVAIGVVAGVLLHRWADRWFPWDALGVVLVAVAVLLVSDGGRLELPGLTDPSIILGGFGLGLALTAGLARLTLDSAKGLSAGEVSLSAGLGVAALVLCQQVMAPVAYLQGQILRELPLTQPLTMLVAALALVVLFGLGRLVRRIRQDLLTEAQQPPVTRPTSDTAGAGTAGADTAGADIAGADTAGADAVR